jgi:hypothetical protein
MSLFTFRSLMQYQSRKPVLTFLLIIILFILYTGHSLSYNTISEIHSIPPNLQYIIYSDSINQQIYYSQYFELNINTNLPIQVTIFQVIYDSDNISKEVILDEMINETLHFTKRMDYYSHSEMSVRLMFQLYTYQHAEVFVEMTASGYPIIYTQIAIIMSILLILVLSMDFIEKLIYRKSRRTNKQLKAQKINKWLIIKTYSNIDFNSYIPIGLFVLFIMLEGLYFSGPQTITLRPKESSNINVNSYDLVISSLYYNWLFDFFNIFRIVIPVLLLHRILEERRGKYLHEMSLPISRRLKISIKALNMTTIITLIFTPKFIGSYHIAHVNKYSNLNLWMYVISVIIIIITMFIIMFYYFLVYEFSKSAIIRIIVPFFITLIFEASTPQIGTNTMLRNILGLHPEIISRYLFNQGSIIEQLLTSIDGGYIIYLLLRLTFWLVLGILLLEILTRNENKIYKLMKNVKKIVQILNR